MISIQKLEGIVWKDEKSEAGVRRGVCFDEAVAELGVVSAGKFAGYAALGILGDPSRALEAIEHLAAQEPPVNMIELRSGALQVPALYEHKPGGPQL